MPFIVDTEGPLGLFGVFEDDGDTGYLYIYEPDVGIHRDLHLYNRSASFCPEESDVEVVWSDDQTSCTVVIRAQPRGTIVVSDLIALRLAHGR